MSIKFVWPVPSSKRVTSKFGTRILYGEIDNHRGVDIGAPLGAPIVAVADGTITFSGPSGGTKGGFGNKITIDHGSGITSTYGHMSKLLVSKGTAVKAGDVIALVGSEGNSTGPHLHIEIAVNGERRNPYTYIADGEVVEVSEDYLSNYIDDFPANYSSTIVTDSGNVIVGQRVAGVTTQPMLAYAQIWLGEHQLLATDPPKPNILQSFEYDKLDDAGEKVTFTLFDDNWQEIEKWLSLYHNNIYVEYGYYGTGIRSERHKLLLLNYHLSFTNTGTIISVEAVTEGVIKNLNPITVGTNTYNPTEAVKKICEAAEFIVEDKNFDPSQDVEVENPPFNLINEHPVTFIIKHIIPQAVGYEGELFSFEVDADNKAYFKSKGYNSTNTSGIRTYIVNKGYDSSVIEFNITSNFVFGGVGDFEFATEYRSSGFATEYRDSGLDSTIPGIITTSASKDSVVTYATGTRTPVNSGQSSQVVDMAGYSPSQAKNIIYSTMKSIRHDAYKATLTIVGDPTIKIKDQYVRIINMTDEEGIYHHTSGIYYILGIVDSISNGVMTTSLELVKNASLPTEATDPLEVLHPKLEIK